MTWAAWPPCRAPAAGSFRTNAYRRRLDQPRDARRSARLDARLRRRRAGLLDGAGLPVVGLAADRRAGGHGPRLGRHRLPPQSLEPRLLQRAGEARPADRWSISSGSCSAIVVAGGVATGITIHVKRRLQVYWRTWLATATTGRWLNSGRQYQLGLLAEECDNPDGRIAEDIRISTEYAVEFAQSILQCILQLITFLGVLWVLSGTLHVVVAGLNFAIPAYMVWAAVLYALDRLDARPISSVAT